MTFIKYLRTLFFFLILGLIILPSLKKADAHVVVKPNEVGIGTFQTFTVSVPNEKDQPVTGLRLLIPASLKSVTPTVKNGWTITADKQNEHVREIEWTGGMIPAGQRDDFSFSTKVPDETATLLWKAYQTYQDGAVVSWDKEPEKTHDENEEDENTGPYSTTLVVDDLMQSESKQEETVSQESKLPLILSGIAVGLSLLALTRSSKKK